MQNSDQIKTEPLDIATKEKKTKPVSKFLTYLITGLKYLLFLSLLFLIADGAGEIWKSELNWFWKFIVDLASLFIFGLIILLWKNISLEGKIVILFLYLTGLIAFFTSYFGTFQDSYSLLGEGTNFLSLLLLLLGTTGGIITLILFPGMPKLMKIILCVTGIYAFAGNLEVFLTRTTLEQGFEGIWIWKNIPFFLRPTVWTIFYFLPLTILILLWRIITKLIKKKKVSSAFTLPLFPLIMITAMGLISFYTNTSMAEKSFDGLIGSLNVLSRENGGEIISYTSQLDLYDHGAFRLNDGDIDCFSPLNWSSSEKTSFPHEIVFALGKPDTGDAYTVNRIIIYNADPANSTGVKDFELYLSADSDKKSFKQVGMFSCKNMPGPQEFSFKGQKAKFAKISISSNWGNDKYTSFAELEIYSDNIQKKPIDMSKNLVSEKNKGRVIYYTDMENKQNESVENLIKSEGETGEIFVFSSEKLPQEIVFRLGKGETFFIDKVLLGFPSQEKSNIKDIEILVSPRSPVSGFTPVWKAAHDQNKTEEVFSFSPRVASYVKLRILSTYSEGSPLLERCQIFQNITPKTKKKETEEKSEGLAGFYFSGLKLKEPQKELSDKQLDFRWEGTFPIQESDNFFINWRGYLSIPSDGLYELAAGAGSGFRLYLDNELIMENSDSPSLDYWNTACLNLPGGEHSIEIYYYKMKNDERDAKKTEGFRLAWKTPYEKEYTIIPGKYLSHKEAKFKRTPSQAAKLGIDWLSEEAEKWQEQNKCYGCHVQPQAIMGLSIAAKNDYPVDSSSVRLMCDYLEGGESEDGSLLFDHSTSVTAAQFMGMSLACYDKYTGNPDKESLINMAHWLQKKQEEDGSWRLDIPDSPIQQGDIMVTANSLITIKQAGLYEKSQEFAEAITKGESWLKDAPAKTTQDLTFQIFGLAGGAGTSPVIKKNVETLFSMQKSDGGWAETEGLESNAFATGQVLYALKIAGINVSEPGFMKGVTYLMENQQVFGSWKSENTTSARPSEYAPTMWAVIGLTGSFESLMVSMKSPQKVEIFSGLEKSVYNKTIESEVFNFTQSPVSYVEYFLDEKSIGKSNKSPYTIEWSQSSLATGKHIMKAIAETESGQKATDENEIFVYGPFKLSIINPQTNDIIGLNADIKVEVTNQTKAETAGVEYFLNERSVGKVEKSPYNLALNTKEIPEGIYELKGVAYKTDGQKTEDKCIIKIEKPFTLQLIEPKENEQISDNKFTIEVKIDNKTGYSTQKVEYYLGEKFLGASEEKPYDFKSDVAGILNGEYKLRAVAVNENNDRAEEQKTIRLNNSLKITIKTPVKGEIISGDTELRADVMNKTASPTEQVEYFIDDKSIGKTSKEQYSLKAEHKNLPQGKHKLKAVVYCNDGGMAIDEMDIEVRHPVEGTAIATVTDEKGKYIVELDPNSFILKEDDAPQSRMTIQCTKNLPPVNMAILLDGSKSMSGSVEGVKDGANNFVSLMETEDRATIIFFAGRVMVKGELTSDKNKLKDTIGMLGSIGGRALYDSIYEAVEKLKKEKGRKAIIFLTDGVDENALKTAPASKHKFSESMNYAKENNVVIYSIGLGEGADKKILNSFSEQTGGKAYFPPSVENLKETYAEIAKELTCQYLITYNSSNFKRDGKWRNVKISIKDNSGYTVRTSEGYKAPSY